MVKHDAQARAVVEAIGDLGGGAELHHMAEILAVALAIHAERKTRRRHDPPAEEDIEPQSGVAVDGAVEGHHDAGKGLEKQQSFRRQVLERNDPGGSVVIEVEGPGAEGQEIRILGPRRPRRRADQQERAKQSPRQMILHRLTPE